VPAIAGSREELVTTPRNRDDQLGTVGTVRPQGFSQKENTLREIGFLNGRISPDGVHQLVFSEEPATVADHINKEVKGPGMKKNRLAGGGEDTIHRIHLESLEPIQSLVFKDHTANKNYLRII
jgi:hypothetical protein